jgi:GAF domain-containing protein
VPGADYAGIMLVKAKRKIESVARTDSLVVDSDKAQEETGEGPCLSVIWRRATFKIDDMESETRWPRFSQRAVALGVRSMLSFQLFVENDNLGALNLLSRSTFAFDAESEHVGLLFAAHAAIALRGAQQATQLEEILGTRDLIGQAKGILMERHHIDANEAFEMLIRASQNSNIKLAEVARYISKPN